MKYLPVNTVIYPSSMPLPYQYQEWKLQQNNPQQSTNSTTKIINEKINTKVSKKLIFLELMKSNIAKNFYLCENLK